MSMTLALALVGILAALSLVVVIASQSSGNGISWLPEGFEGWWLGWRLQSALGTAAVGAMWDAGLALSEWTILGVLYAFGLGLGLWWRRNGRMLVDRHEQALSDAELLALAGRGGEPRGVHQVRDGHDLPELPEQVGEREVAQTREASGT